MAQKPAEIVGFRAPDGTNAAIRSAAKRMRITPSAWLRQVVLERLGKADNVQNPGRPRKNGAAE